MDFEALANVQYTVKPFEAYSLEEKIVAMARVGADLHEIAVEVGTDAETLRLKHRPLLLKAYARGHYELRAAQHAQAMAGNQTLLKHLGAARLKQIDALLASQADELAVLDQQDLKKLSKAELIELLETKLKLLKDTNGAA